VQKGDELMAEELFIPQLGQTVEEVVLINWLVEDGASVDFGTPVLEVETDKAIFTVEANAKGYLHKGPHAMGITVPVLTVVATIGKQDELFETSPTSSTPELVSAGTAAEAQKGDDGASSSFTTNTQEVEERHPVSPRARKLAIARKVDLSKVPATGGGGTRVIEKDVINYLIQVPKATPVAAAMAADLGMNLVGITGTGPKGTVTKSDVEKALSVKSPSYQAPAPPPDASVSILENEVANNVPLSGIRRLIFERMGSSVHTTARVTLVTEADATDFVQARDRLKEGTSEAWGFAPGYNDLIGIIVARALREFPYMNARVSIDGKSIEWLARINLGMAVDTERGLTVPVIQDADHKGLREFGTFFRQMVERARAGRSLPEDLSGGTFTITNLGMYDIDAFTPVINLPEAAILGVGRIQDKVVPYKGNIQVRQMLTLSLVFDHRLNDGAPAARFLQRIKQYIENPLLLVG
jgi:pyruvate dehydrogenase E2 component (dihydrolipoamide acetyltransferase)